MHEGVSPLLVAIMNEDVLDNMCMGVLSCVCVCARYTLGVACMYVSNSIHVCICIYV